MKHKIDEFVVTACDMANWPREGMQVHGYTKDESEVDCPDCLEAIKQEKAEDKLEKRPQSV